MIFEDRDPRATGFGADAQRKLVVPLRDDGRDVLRPYRSATAMCVRFVTTTSAVLTAVNLACIGAGTRLHPRLDLGIAVLLLGLVHAFLARHLHLLLEREPRERLTSAADVMDEAVSSLTASQSRELGADDAAGLFTELSAASAAYERSLVVTRRLLALPSLASST